MCKASRGAREDFEAKYGTPMKWLSKRLAVEEEDSSSSEESSEEDDSESSDGWIKPARGLKKRSEKEKDSKGRRATKGRRYRRSPERTSTRRTRSRTRRIPRRWKASRN